MVRGYLAAGEPEVNVPSSRFRHHDRLVRKVLIWLGLADPWENMKLIENQDPVALQLGALVTAWYGVFGSTPTKVKDAIREAAREAEHGDSAAKIEARARLYEAMEEVSRHRAKPSPWVIGNFIRKYEKRYQNGLRFEEAGKAQHVTRWQVKPASGHSQVSSEGHSGEGAPKAQAKKAGPKIHIKVPSKYMGLTPTNGVSHGSDPDPHPHAGTVSVNGNAANGSASDHAAGVHATAEDGAPVLSEQEHAELKDQL